MNTNARVTTEAQARDAGFIREIVASSPGQDLNVLIAPDTDFDSEFAAFDLDAHEMISVKGWPDVFEYIQ